MPSADIDLAHQPGVAFFLIMVTLAALAMTLINLRNAGLWLLRISGRRSSGVVDNIEIVTSPNGEVLRRPRVRFTTTDGQPAAGAPVIFRKTTSLIKGTAVTVSYARRNPTRVVVHGYDFRMREVVYAVLGVVIAIGVAATYFRV